MSDDEEYHSPPDYGLGEPLTPTKKELAHDLAMTINKHRSRVMFKKPHRSLVRRKTRKRRDPLKFPKFY